MEIPSISIPTSREGFIFPASSHSFQDKCSQRSTIKLGRCPENVFQSAYKTHKRNFGKFFYTKQFFQQLWTIKVQTADFRKFSFNIHNPCSRLKVRRTKEIFITVARKASCCFVLIADFFVMKLKYMIITTNVHLIWKNTRYSVVGKFKRLPTLFYVL